MTDETREPEPMTNDALYQLEIEELQARVQELEREVARLKKIIADENARSVFHRGIYDTSAAYNFVTGIATPEEKRCPSVRNTGHHDWARRRDGRECADCGAREFGDLTAHAEGE